MGKLYTKYVLQGENILATFEDGTVYSPTGTIGTGHQVLMYYDGNRIYRSVSSPFGDGFPNVLARCNEFGGIESEDGTRLGYCEGGKVKNAGGSEIAYYDGDMYGAAAAACAVLFGLREKDQTADAGDMDSGERKSDDVGNGGDSSPLRLIFSFLLSAFLTVVKFLWKLVKTIHLWGPYVFPLLLSCVIMAPAFLFIPILLYMALHTVALLKCKKRQGKGKYRPVIIGFILFLVFFFLPAIPADIYLIVWLIRDQKQRDGLTKEQQEMENETRL